MIIIEVTINDDPPVRAGIDDFGVISAILITVLRQPKDGVSEPRETQMSLGGLHSPRKESWRWFERAVGVGDRISIRILEGENPDPPARVTPPDPERYDKERRRHYEQLKKEFEGK